MNFWQRLWRVQIAGLTSLAVFSVILGALFVLEGLVVSPRETDAFEILLLVFALSFFYGLLPVTLLGAPAYAALHSLGQARWPPLLIIVLLPGVAMVFYHRGVGLISLAAGPIILFMTHALYQRRISRDS